MKKSLLLLAMALVLPSAKMVAQTDSIVVDSTLTYDFESAYQPLYTLHNLNCGWAFYSWEKSGKEDSFRQDYKGYAIDSVSAAAGLPDECHIWVRNPRLVSSIYENGFNVTQDKNFVVDGLTDGDKVVIKYTTEATDSAKQKIIYATSATGKTSATVDGDTLVAGVSVINSGDTIAIDTARFVNNKNVADGYISVLLYKGTCISEVTILKADTVAYKYDLTAVGQPLTPGNLNRNQNNVGKIYVYEGVGKENRNKNDFKGYASGDVATELGLPSECHVFQSSDRIVQHFTHKGIAVVNNRLWVVDGLDSLDQVQVYYDATGLDSAYQQIAFANGASSNTYISANDSDSLVAKTPITSGQTLTVLSSSDTDKYGVVNGYLAFQTYKGMHVTKVVITKRHAVTATGISNIENTTQRADSNVWYNLQGMRVENPSKGIYIHNGKKVIVR